MNRDKTSLVRRHRRHARRRRRLRRRRRQLHHAFDKGGPADGKGRFFSRLDAFGRPTDEMDASALALQGVAVVGGTFQAYYMAPPRAHGIWTETYAMRARDGSLVSTRATLTVDVKCSPGFVAETDAFGTADTSLGTCEACPMGSISAGFGAVTCSKCPLGMFSGDAMAGSCSLCPGGTYADVEGLVFCKACPLGSTSDVGAVSIDACYCAVGFYGTPGNCRPCPNKGAGGRCTNGPTASRRTWRCRCRSPAFTSCRRITRWRSRWRCGSASRTSPAPG